MNYLSFFALFQTIFTSVKEAPGNFELDLPARVNIATAHLLSTLRILGYSDHSALTIDAGDNVLPTLVFIDPAYPASVTIPGLLIPPMEMSASDNGHCLKTEFCPLPAGLLSGLLVPFAPVEASEPGTNIHTNTSVSQPILETTSIISLNYVSAGYLLSINIAVLFVLVFIKVSKFSQYILNRRLRSGTTSTPRTVFRRAPMGALVQYKSLQVRKLVGQAPRYDTHGPAVFDSHCMGLSYLRKRMFSSY